MPDDNEQTIVWDPEKKKWVDKNADPNDEPEFKPPPTRAAGGGSAAGGLGGRVTNSIAFIYLQFKLFIKTRDALQQAPS